MFGIDSGELLIVALVALVVIGPKDLPRAMRTIGNWVGRARGMARQFRSGFDNMVREAELDDMEKQWKAQNEQIMRDHPMPPVTADSDWGLPPAAALPPVTGADLPPAGTPDEFAPADEGTSPDRPLPAPLTAPAMATPSRRPAPLPPPGLL